MTLSNDSVAVTPGTGATIATHLAGSKEHQVVMIAEPTGHLAGSHAVYVASAVAMAKGASKNYLSVYNADAALKVDILQAYIAQELTVAVTGLVRGYRLLRFGTVHSGGSTPTPRALDSQMPALDADITIRSNGQTIGGAEAEPLGIVGVNEEETGSAGGRAILFDWRHSEAPITLNQNQGVVIQQDSTAGTGILSALILFRVR